MGFPPPAHSTVTITPGLGADLAGSACAHALQLTAFSAMCSIAITPAFKAPHLAMAISDHVLPVSPLAHLLPADADEPSTGRKDHDQRLCPGLLPRLRAAARSRATRAFNAQDAHDEPWLRTPPVVRRRGRTSSLNRPLRSIHTAHFTIERARRVTVTLFVSCAQ